MPPAFRSLDVVPPGASAVIISVDVEEASLRDHLAALGLIPGIRVDVEEQAPFGGPRLVRVGGARYALGRDVAARILVTEA